MKTATITLHSAHNNGSFLQAFALQKAIESMNIENKIINYIPEAQYSLYQNIIFKDSTLKGVVKGLLNIPHYYSLLERKNRFNKAQSILKLTDKFEDEKQFEAIVQPYDCLIAGSDQIWNSATMPDFTPLYFLPINKYKISYAPSCGKSLKKQFSNEKYLKQIESFNKLSVRERSVQSELQKHLQNKAVDMVLDPTFLLDKIEYKSLENNAKRKYQGDYIFFYCIKASNEVLKTVQKIGKKLGLPVITVFTGVNTYKCQIYGQKIDFSAGPEEFVDYIKNAKYVVSNSFHGIVFSIIYNKIFYRIADNDNGHIKIDERLDSILNLLDLATQNVIAGDNPQLYTDINFDLVNKKLEILKNDSLEWLRTSLTSAKGSDTLE